MVSALDAFTRPLPELIAKVSLNIAISSWLSHNFTHGSFSLQEQLIHVTPLPPFDRLHYNPPRYYATSHNFHVTVSST